MLRIFAYENTKGKKWSMFMLNWGQNAAAAKKTKKKTFVAFLFLQKNEHSHMLNKNVLQAQ